MCQNLMEMDHVAQEFGWYGYSEGPGPNAVLIYYCGCGNHDTYVANDADDPDYYAKRCEFIRLCRTA